MTCNPCPTLYLIFLVLCASLILQFYNTIMMHRRNAQRRAREEHRNEPVFDADGVRRSRRSMERDAKRDAKSSAKVKPDGEA